MWWRSLFKVKVPLGRNYCWFSGLVQDLAVWQLRPTRTSECGCNNYGQGNCKTTKFAGSADPDDIPFKALLTSKSSDS